MSNARSPTQYQGVRAIAPPDLTLAKISPPAGFRPVVKGQLYLDTVAESAYMWSGATWIALGSGTTGAIVTLTGDSGGAISPVAGNIDILGDSVDGVSVVGTAGTLTINVAAASTTQRGTLETSTDAESVTGTSLLVSVTPASLTARLAAPGAIGGTTPAAGTFTNVTVNDILAIDGGAATDFIGTATLIAGQATVANTNITTADRILISRNALNASPALGHLIYTISAGVGFTVDSYDASGVAAATDVSGFSYVIVRQV